jgi:hypothetical protein
LRFSGRAGGAMLEGTVVMARLLLLGQIRNPQRRGFGLAGRAR